MKFFPQEGLLSFRIASLTPSPHNNSQVFSAPRRKKTVTSSPRLFFTPAAPFMTVRPSPPVISAGALGVVNPPNCSGHTGRTFLPCSFRSNEGERLLFPLYRHFSPSRQALTRMGEDFFTIRLPRGRNHPGG